MSEKEQILEAMRKAGVPLNAGKVAELTGLDRKVVDKAFAAMKRKALLFPPSDVSGNRLKNDGVDARMTGIPSNDKACRSFDIAED